MKRFFSILFVATMLGMVFTACGDEKDEPVQPTHKYESVYTAETDTHFVFDIDLDKDSSSIYLYNVVFTIDDRQSPAMNIRIDAPCTVDKTGKIFLYQGTNITPFQLRGNTPVPMPSMPVNNLACTIDTKNKYFEMYFECHGGEYYTNGKLR